MQQQVVLSHSSTIQPLLCLAENGIVAPSRDDPVARVLN
jgi:hypothetical protein